MLHPDDVENTVGEWQSAIATGEAYSTAFRLRRADGEYRWFRVAARPERADDGSVVKWWGNAVDVHDTRLLEEEASALAQEREDILDAIGDGVVALDRDMRFVYLNANAERLLRRPASDARRRVHLGQVRQRDGERFSKRPWTRRARPARGATSPTGARQLAGWFEGSVSPTAQGLTVYFRDITELKSMSEQLAQAQRMESVGRLTGGIAHDFNNLLTVVVGGAEALEDEPGLTDEGRELLGLVASAASRGAELTHQLLAFSRQQPLAPHLVDVSERVRDMGPILSRAIGPGIELVPDLAEGLPTALVDPGQLENALLNLAINAGDAMPDGGKLTISTSAVHLAEADSTLHSGVLAGDYIVVSVGDNGTGIADEHLPHIFEPFYTTKEAGEGSGLGLSMVWGFAKQTGGHVTVYSEEGLGSIFRLYLPVATEGAVAADAAAPSARAQERGSGTILLAEDDPLVRQFAAERLRDHGYEVTEREHGSRGVGAARRDGRPQPAVHGRHHEGRGLRSRARRRGARPSARNPRALRLGIRRGRRGAPGATRRRRCLARQAIHGDTIDREGTLRDRGRRGKGARVTEEEGAAERVLIIDDDPDVGRLLQLQIEATGRETRLTG